MVFLFFVSLIFMIGCNSNTLNTKQLQLATPQNLLFDGVVKWGSVDNALNYEVSINGTNYLVDDNFYIIVEEGQYEITVIAKGAGYLDSLVSDLLIITVDYEAEVDFSFDLNGNLLSWTDVQDAVGYNLYIDAVKYETDTNSFDISDIKSGVLRITVQAAYPVGVSNVSSIFTLANDLSENSEIALQYSINSTADIILWESFTGPIYIMSSDGLFLDNSSVLNIDEQQVSILSSYIKNQNVTNEEEEHVLFYIISQNVKTPINVKVTNNLNPYIISQSVRTVDGSKDVSFQFELFGGTFFSVNGTKDDVVLYETTSSVLVVKKEFITGKFEEKDSFVLSYVINKDEDSVIGYLNFNKQ